jgi:hypothetical protein
MQRIEARRWNSLLAIDWKTIRSEIAQIFAQSDPFISLSLLQTMKFESRCRRNVMAVFTMLVLFEGEGAPVPDAAGFVRSEARGTILSVSGGALPPEGEVQSPAGEARFSTMVFAQDGRFFEAGRVDFPGIGSHLIVTTRQPGTSNDLPGGASAGSISWTVTGGGGRFEGATGIVTGNFTARADGRFFDHQLFKLILPN